MGKSYSISSSDFETYIDSAAATTEKHPLSNWMALQSQLYVEGISQLHSVLTEGRVVDMNTIRSEHSESLLRDLERASKRQDAHEIMRIPDFKPEFYDELKKPAVERSEDYQVFVKACCEKFTARRHMTETISANALKQLEAPELGYDDFNNQWKKPSQITNKNIQNKLQWIIRELLFYLKIQMAKHVVFQWKS